MNTAEKNLLKVDRRNMLHCLGGTLLNLALNRISGKGGVQASQGRSNPPGVSGFPERIPKAKRVIYLFQAGGPSQIDLFDHKPLLQKWDGRDLPKSVMGNVKFTGMVNGQSRFPVVGSRWKFRQHGQSGAWISDLFPEFATVADDVCFIKSMTTTQVDHDAAITFLQTGHQIAGRPAIGAWAAYGLGSECENLPAYVVLRSQDGGSFLIDRHWGSGFLPSRYQGIRVGSSDSEPVKYLSNPEGITKRMRRRTITDIAALNQSHFEQVGDPEIQTRIAQFEMAARMQMSVPELADFRDEPKHILELYGKDVTVPGTYAYNALLARRLAERDVRFIQLFQGGWDQHSNLPKQIEKYSAYSDRANAALIKDLKQRGMLDDTLVIWGGEFGRTVFCQGKLTKTNFGREHHHLGFTVWMAGARIRPGVTYGKTDDWSFHAVENPVPTHDLNATVLHLLGIDHRHLTYRYSGPGFSSD